MYLHRLRLTNFKNYENIDLEFSGGINCFVGNNGVGKTNILDAIHYLSLAKSFFSHTEAMSIRHGEEFYMLKGLFNNGDGEDDISCSFVRQKQKTMRINGKDYDRLSDHVGRFPAVMVSPADSSLVTEGSEERRRFMNKIISQYNSEYLHSVVSYNRALLSRNKLLKDYASGQRFDEEMILSFDLQLERYGTAIYRERRELVNRLAPLFQDYYDTISMKREPVELLYRSQLAEAALSELLAGSRQRDRYLQYTSVGIHKDDLVFNMSGHPVRQTGSQGQQKSYLAALKLAKFAYISAMTGKTPLLLLDDLFDKFDADRVGQLMSLLAGGGFGQIFITDTHQDRLLRILKGVSADYRFFRIGVDGVEEVIHNGLRHEKE